MKCAEALDFLQTEMDGELPAAAERALTGHLASCEECRHLREDLVELTAWAVEEPAASGPRGSLAGPVLSAIRSERRGLLLRRGLLATTVAAAALLWTATLPGLLRPAPEARPLRPSPRVVETVGSESALAQAPGAMLHEWKAFALTGQTREQDEVRMARAEREQVTAQRLLRPRPLGEKPDETAERRRAVRDAAAVAAAELGAKGVALLEEAVRDPRRAPDVLAGVTGQSRTELVPVFIAAMRHRNCRDAARTLAEEATGLELGGDPADWRAWWECRLAGRRKLSPIEAATGRAIERRVPETPPSSDRDSPPDPVMALAEGETGRCSQEHA